MEYTPGRVRVIGVAEPPVRNVTSGASAGSTAATIVTASPCTTLETSGVTMIRVIVTGDTSRIGAANRTTSRGMSSHGARHATATTPATKATRNHGPAARVQGSSRDTR